MEPDVLGATEQKMPLTTEASVARQFPGSARCTPGTSCARPIWLYTSVPIPDRDQFPLRRNPSLVPLYAGYGLTGSVGNVGVIASSSARVEAFSTAVFRR